MDSIFDNVDSDIIATRSESGFNGLTDTGGVFGLGTSTSGATIGKHSSGRPVKANMLKQGCCSTTCSERWNNGTITTLHELGECVRIHCKLK